MGGFVFETSAPIFGSCTRFTLTFAGVVFLMVHEPELIPDLSENSILHRSQSDSLGKALLVVQLLYFCISCAARWAQSLPLTLLEVSTLAHAACAIATYFVWWKKPFNVADPTVISGTAADEVAAYFLLISRGKSRRLAGVLHFSCSSEYSSLKISPTNQLSKKPVLAVDETAQALRIYPGHKIWIGDFTFSVRNRRPYRFPTAIYGKDLVPWFHRGRGPDKSVYLCKEDLTRWRQAARGMTRFPHHRPRDDTTFVSWKGGLQQSVMMWPFGALIIATLYVSCHLLG